MDDTSAAPGATALPDWPLFGWTHDVRPALACAMEAGVAAVLATLHAAVGGAPRPVGSQLLVVDGQLHGFLSGGCIEGDLAARAEQVRRTGEPQRLVYGDGSPFADIRLVCGGRIEVLLERLTSDDPAVVDLIAAWRARRPTLWASDGRTRVCLPDAPGAFQHARNGPLGAALAALSPPDVACASVADGRALALRQTPTPRLIVVGGDPTALAIAQLAGQSGYETHLLRPKGPSTPPPLSNVAYHRGAPAEALGAIGLDAWTHVAVATHGLEEDEDALVAALPSPAAYVGVLGARRRLPERLHRLGGRGVDAASLERLHAPIGLDIGGKAPFEIAVSVLAEITAERHRALPGRAVRLDGETA